MKNQIELEDIESSVITSALNEYWNDAHKQLEEGGVRMSNGELRPLGDIEKALLIKRKELVYPLLERFENL